MLLFISIMDSTSIRDPKKRDVIQIANIEGDRLIKFPYLALLEENLPDQLIVGIAMLRVNI